MMEHGQAIVVPGEFRAGSSGAPSRAPRAGPPTSALRWRVPLSSCCSGSVIHPSARDATRQLDAIALSSSGRPGRW
jgi:hypothetical protein